MCVCVFLRAWVLVRVWVWCMCVYVCLFWRACVGVWVRV